MSRERETKRNVSRETENTHEIQCDGSIFWDDEAPVLHVLNRVVRDGEGGHAAVAMDLVHEGLEEGELKFEWT